MSNSQFLFLFALPFLVAIVALVKEFLFRSDAAHERSPRRRDGDSRWNRVRHR